MIALLAGIIGAVMRRIWGGWLSLNHFVKLGIAIAIYFILGVLSGEKYYIAILPAIIMGFSFDNKANNLYMRFGEPDGALPNPSWLTCLIWQTWTNAAYCLAASGVAFFFDHNLYHFWYVLFSCLSPYGYVIAVWLDGKKIKIPTIKLFGSDFYDGSNCLGELVLGAVNYAGYALFM
jgi:hypothetical protein